MYHWHDFENKRRGTLQFPVEFHHVEESHPRYVMPYHWHREIELIRVVDGGGVVVSSDTKSYSLKKGDFLYIKPNSVHGAEPAAGCVYQCIVCDLLLILENNPAVQAYAKFFAGKEINSFYDETLPKPRAVLERLFDAMQARREGYRLAVVGCLLEFLSIIMEEKLFNEESEETAIRSAHNVARFGNVFSLIRNKCDTPITLEDMASEANMSPNYFCQAFKEATHYTPIEYLTHYRIEYSKYLLCAKDCTVQEAAFAAGFSKSRIFH